MDELTEQNKFIEHLVHDKVAFDEFVYTPWREAILELKERESNPNIDFYLKENLPTTTVPSIMQGTQSIVLFRNIATPNYEMRRFMSCVDVLSNTAMNHIIFEYRQDKFADINELKFALGQMCFYKGLNKIKQPILEYRNIIDFTKSNGKAISSLQTFWGESLVEFHHKILLQDFPLLEKHVYDISDWLNAIGKHSGDYYKTFLSLFLKHGILFENFMTSKHHLSLTKKVILPAILEIEARTGKKPLIVALEPTSIEGDSFWSSYPYEKKAIVDTKLRQ